MEEIKTNNRKKTIGSHKIYFISVGLVIDKLNGKSPVKTLKG
jgi:hypothetical protein